MIGLKPRQLSWILPNRLAIGERPGGSGVTHRRIRREEEICWLDKNQFAVVVSVLPGSHNLQAYDDASVRCIHLPMPPRPSQLQLRELFTVLDDEVIGRSQRTFLHGDEVDDLLTGLCGAYLMHLGIVDNHPSAVATIERATSRPLGPDGRAIVRSVDPVDHV